MAGRAADHSGRAALVFGLGDLDGPGAESRVSPGAAPAEGLIGSILQLLGLDLAMPDQSTLSRRAETLEVPLPATRSSGEPMHLLKDSTGLKLCGPGEKLVEEQGTRTRRGWRKLHLATDADTGRIVASMLTDHDVDDSSLVGPLLDQINDSVASFTADGAFDREDVYAEVTARHPDVEVIVPPRCGEVPCEAVETAPTQRDGHIGVSAELGRMGRQKVSGYKWRALVEECRCIAARRSSLPASRRSTCPDPIIKFERCSACIARTKPLR